VKPSESQIQKACEDILRAHRWRILRFEQNYSVRKRKVVGERGMPDVLAMRYYRGTTTQSVWIEFKTPKGKPSDIQLRWHATERLLGAFTAIAGLDFPATIEGFEIWAKKNGLIPQ
jgi:hypothetical protein